MSDETEIDENPDNANDKVPMDPVRKWTLIILGACVFLMAWYVVADRITPYTTQARVHALVVPVAAEVSGTVTAVAVTSNQTVALGDATDPDPRSSVVGFHEQRIAQLTSDGRQIEHARIAFEGRLQIFARNVLLGGTSQVGGTGSPRCMSRP